jgi:hypothetical protein
MSVLRQTRSSYWYYLRIKYLSIICEDSIVLAFDITKQKTNAKNNNIFLQEAIEPMHKLQKKIIASY